MKKVICDVCGTAFSDSSDQCPICGSAKPVDLGESSDASGESSSGTTYTYAKGGRFTKANVRKRNKAAGLSRPVDPEDDEEYYSEPDNGGSRGLMIAVIMLLLAIVAVIAYIAFVLLGDSAVPEQTNGTKPSYEQVQTTAGTTVPETTEADLSCTGLELESSEVVLAAAGESVLINAYPQPANTPDTLQYSSSNPDIATVTDEGKVTAIAPGEAEITVTCGEQTAVCKVVCQFEVETTEPEETVSEGNYGMFIDNQNVETRRFKNEVTLPHGSSFRLTMVDLDTDEVLAVEWVVDKQNIVTISGNTVTAAGNGTVRISYTVGETTYTCIVRVTE